MWRDGLDRAVGSLPSGSYSPGVPPTARPHGPVVLPGVSLTWRVTAGEDGPPVVALHGMCSSAATWDRFAARLADCGRTTLALDLRGHGGSPRPGTYACSAMRDDVLAFLDTQRISQVDLLGHSLGGHVAVLVAQAQPRRVRRLVVEDASPPPASPHDAALATSRQRIALAAQSLLLLGHVRAFDVRMTRSVLTEVLATPDPVWWAALARITATTMLVSGGDTSHVSAARLVRVVDQVPDCRLVTVTGAGHRVHSKHPEQFAQAVLPFLTA